MKFKKKTSEKQGGQYQEPTGMRELELLINKIVLLEEITPPKKLLIDCGPSVRPGSCHTYETERIEEIREELRDRGESILRCLKRYRTGNARWVSILITHAFSKHDSELFTIAQKLAKCSCTCGEYVDPI